MTDEAIVNQSVGYMYSVFQTDEILRRQSNYVCFHCHIHITFSFKG